MCQLRKALGWIPVIEQLLVALTQRGEDCWGFRHTGIPKPNQETQNCSAVLLQRIDPALPGALPVDVQLTLVLFFIIVRVPLAVVLS